MAILWQILRDVRWRLHLWQQERLFDAWRDEWRMRRGY